MGFLALRRVCHFAGYRVFLFAFDGVVVSDNLRIRRSIRIPLRANAMIRLRSERKDATKWLRGIEMDAGPLLRGDAMSVLRLESGIPFPLLDLERPRSRECLSQRISTCELNAVVSGESDAVDFIV